MDWAAFALSLQLGVATLAFLLPLSLAVGRTLAVHRFAGRGVVEALVALPLVLPPTVLGFYLLQGFSNRSVVGQVFASWSGHALAFSFEGLVLASVLVNLPFAVQPIQRAFESVPADIREAAACCGMSPWRSLLTVELPLAWPGTVTAAILAFAHTLGEFGVVLMVGGNIPAETRTLSIAIYDRMQAFDDRAAGVMAATLLLLALITLAVTNVLSRRVVLRRD
ncbi:MAG TPA: molybdate ABC transporter permease subunit [Vicinamibacterales bacterium]|jgi:molybdate transport system permease protein